MPPELSNSYLIQRLQEAGEVLGRVPTAVQIDSLKGFPTRKTYEFHFGGWNKALLVAGFEVNEEHGLESRIRQLTEGEAMSFAMAVDTDGSVGVNLNRGIYWEVHLKITNNSLELLEYIQEMVGGGRIGEHKIKHLRPAHNDQFVLNFRVNEIRDLLFQTIPFFIIKQERALEVLTLLEDRHAVSLPT